MNILRRLLKSVPYLFRVPDQSVIAGDPGRGDDHARVTRDPDGFYMMFHLPTGRGQ